MAPTWYQCPLPPLTSSAAAFPARTSRPQVGGPEYMAKSRAFGFTSHDWFATYDPDLSSWKTPQLSLLVGSVPYSETWPRSGTMQSGRASAQSMWEPPTAVGGRSSSVSIPTPTATMADRGGKPRPRQGGPDLRAFLIPTPTATDNKGSTGKGSRRRTAAEFVMMYPTPTATQYGSNQGGSAGRVGKVRHSLWSMARHGLWPTPTCGDAAASGSAAYKGQRPKSGTTLTDATRALDSVATGYPNPTWVEWLMGLPSGWTDVPGSER